MYNDTRAIIMLHLMTRDRSSWSVKSNLHSGTSRTQL